MECKFNPKMVVLFVAAIIFLYFVISGSLLTIFMYESFANSDSETFNGEISSCAPIENNVNNSSMKKGMDKDESNDLSDNFHDKTKKDKENEKERTSKYKM